MLINWGESTVAHSFEEMGAIELQIKLAIQGAKESDNPELADFAKNMAVEFNISVETEEGVI